MMTAWCSACNCSPGQTLRPSSGEIDRYPDSDARQMAHECYADLADLDVRELGAERDELAGSGAVPFLRFSGEAQEGFTEWRASLERRVRGDDLPAPLVPHPLRASGAYPPAGIGQVLN